MVSRLRTEGVALSRLGALAHVEGLASERGLRFFGGDVQLYRRALAQFIDMYGGGLTMPASRLSRAASQRLLREVHAVAGACAVIGAMALMDEAAALEVAITAAPVDFDRQAVTAMHRSLLALAERLRLALGAAT